MRYNKVGFLSLCAIESIYRIKRYRKSEVIILRLKELRLSKNITQIRIAKDSGLSQSYINELETGKKTNPTIQTLEKLAKALGVSIAELTEKAG